MPHVVIVNAVYPPEPVVSAQMGRDLAVYLAAKDTCVTVLCPFPSRPLGTNYAAFKLTGHPLVRSEEGVTVVRLPSFAEPRSRLLSRMLESWSFGCQVRFYLQRYLPNVDVIYANTWPLFSQVLLAWYCIQRNIPLVWHIQDLYPEALLVKLPRYVSKMIARPLIFLDRWLVRQAQQTVVLSKGLRQVYLENRGLPADKVTTVSNWLDERQFERLPERAEGCKQYNVSERKFTFLYLGNIGSVAGVEFLIKAFHAARLKNAQLVIVGDGSAKAGCIELAKRLQETNVQFISDPEVANVPLLQSLAHICLLPLRKGAALSSIPSKLITYLFSGKPVLATLDAESDTARCIREGQCGWVGEPEQASWLSCKMAEVVTLSPQVLEAMGQRGRIYGLKHFSKAFGVRQLANIIFKTLPA